MLPNVGAIGANLGAYATLWQQEQIDIAPYNFNFVQTLKGKDVPVDLSIPGTGAVGWSSRDSLRATRSWKTCSGLRPSNASRAASSRSRSRSSGGSCARTATSSARALTCRSSRAIAATMKSC